MNTDEAIRLLNRMKKDPRAKELVRGLPQPAGEEEAVAVYADLAVKLGCELSREEIWEGLRALSRAQRTRTAAARREMEKNAIGEDALDWVVGGAGTECVETYNDDFCWWEDACDRFLNFYS